MHDALGASGHQERIRGADANEILYHQVQVPFAEAEIDPEAERAPAFGPMGRQVLVEGHQQASGPAGVFDEAGEHSRPPGDDLRVEQENEGSLRRGAPIVFAAEHRHDAAVRHGQLLEEVVVGGQSSFGVEGGYR